MYILIYCYISLFATPNKLQQSFVILNHNSSMFYFSGKSATHPSQISDTLTTTSYQTESSNQSWGSSTCTAFGFSSQITWSISPSNSWYQSTKEFYTTLNSTKKYYTTLNSTCSKLFLTFTAALSDDFSQRNDCDPTPAT